MNKRNVIEIDGAAGEGGGQILRTSLTLSMLTGRPFRMKNIRSKRPRPGLLRQHLTSVEAAARVSSAFVEGAEMRSAALYFEPGPIAGGVYEFAIGTAGSTCLVLQTVLLPLLFASKASTVEIKGGTHNGMSPPFEFLRDAFAPILARLGGKIELSLLKHGFYPAGGGALKCLVHPTDKLEAVALSQRGKLKRLTAKAVVSALPQDIAHRELEVLAKTLKLRPNACESSCVDKPVGPGNVVWLNAEFEHHQEVFAEVGARGIRAEHIARSVAQSYQEYLRSNAVVGEHLADQLVLLLAVAGGGSFTTVKPSAHTKTNIATIRAFMNIDIDIDKSPQHWQIHIRQPE